MNRYSFLFAAIVAATFVTPSGNSRDTAPAVEGSVKAPDLRDRSNPGHALKTFGVDPYSGLDEFLKKRAPQSSAAGDEPDVLFATVPHPVETHLAAVFDESIASLQQGIQDAGYLFDSAWIPWEQPKSYNSFNDDGIEKQAIEYQDSFPGILLFRNSAPQRALETGSEAVATKNPYSHGLIVFLITENPTAGLAVPQVDKALEILNSRLIPLKSPVRIAGPNFSGSMASLGPALRSLHKANDKADFLIRSGGITIGSSVQKRVAEYAADMPRINIDFGSANHDLPRWNGLVRDKLDEIGISPEHVAFLSEDESSYGGGQANRAFTVEGYSSLNWHIPFPRDISSLRAGYEKQGIFDASSSAQPWKRILDLKTEDGGEGDSVRSFGGAATVETQESVLLGISDFLKAHTIRAIVISATNPEDTYFLSQFFHAHNSGVRIISVGATRLFLRGATAQFRGDLVVDDLPMLPRLYDWTAGNPQSHSSWSYFERVYATGFAKGIYMATIDLLPRPDFPNNIYRPYPEYSAPDWGAERSVQRPPMYLTSLGSETLWPVGMHDDLPFLKGDLNPCPGSLKAPLSSEETAGSWRVEMPFLLLGHNCGTIAPQAPRGAHPGTSHFWTILFLLIWTGVIVYCVCFFYADPIHRRLCASFQPIADGRYWVFTVTIPAILAGWAFQVIAAPLDVPAVISSSMARGWWAAIASSIAAPLLVSLSSWLKARQSDDSIGFAGKRIAMVLPVLMALIFALLHLWSFSGRPGVSEIGSILNSYREMHWESGLSLIPSWLLILFALFLWTRQASQSTVLFHIPPVLPTFPNDARISDSCTSCMDSIGRPMPDLRDAKWLWSSWLGGVIFMLVVVTFLPSFRAVTTLESYAATRCLLYAATAIASLMLLDICQFLWLWNELRKLLRALDSRVFKRSFVPIPDFKWAGFWSFAGVSFYDQRVILSAMADCIEALRSAPFGPRIAELADAMASLRIEYRNFPSQPSIIQYRVDLAGAYDIIARISSEVANQMELGEFPEPRKLSFEDELALRNKCCPGDKKPRFADESEEAARLLDWQQTSEKLVCLNYIAYIQTAIARLHGLMLSVAGVFSLIAVAIAIYPFAPMHPFFLSGLTLFPAMAWAFFHVFSQMDTDPILARITNGDDRKLEWNFYGKFAESLALPVLTLASSLLPGGAGRLLEVARTMLVHSQ